MRNNITLRQMRIGDLELVLAWRSNPRIYQHFRDQNGPLAWEDHISWFGSRGESRSDFIIEYSGRRVGTVAVAEDGDVGIYIGEESLWGNGVATQALRKVMERVDRKLVAQIHDDNQASKELFEKVGFEQVGEEGNWVEYEKRFP